MNELDDVDIRHFKLSSGEEILSLVVKEEDNTWVLSKPMQIHSIIDEDKQSCYFTQWLPLAKMSLCAVSRLHVVCAIECANDVKERYVRMCTDFDPLLGTNIIDIDMDYGDNEDMYDMDHEEDFYHSTEPQKKDTIH